MNTLINIIKYSVGFVVLAFVSLLAINGLLAVAIGIFITSVVAELVYAILQRKRLFPQSQLTIAGISIILFLLSGGMVSLVYLAVQLSISVLNEE